MKEKYPDYSSQEILKSLGEEYKRIKVPHLLTDSGRAPPRR